MKYQDVAEYLSALKADASLAVISFQMAADALDITRAAIERRVRAGELSEVAVGRTRLIRATSVRGVIEAWQEKVTTVERILVRAAHKQEVLFYDPVMTAIGLDTKVPSHRGTIGAILGEISERSFEIDGFMLSALVYNKNKGRPSDSFFGLANNLGAMEGKSEQDFLKQQKRKIYKHYS